MSTNLPKSRNRNLPPPPAEPADVRRRPVAPPVPQAPVEEGRGDEATVRRRRVMTPVQQAPEDNGRGEGPTLLRSVMAMLIVGGMLFAGIFFYIRSSESDSKKRQEVSSKLEMLGRQIWEMQGNLTLPAGNEEWEKDFADLPRIFAAVGTQPSKKGITPTVRVIEGDPPPGRGNATHQVQYSFNSNSPDIILHFYYDVKENGVLFVGVHNRFTTSRKDFESESKPADPAAKATQATQSPGTEEKPVTPPANTTPPANQPPPVNNTPPATVPPAPTAPAPAPPSAPAEKVSVPPANPR